MKTIKKVLNIIVTIFLIIIIVIYIKQFIDDRYLNYDIENVTIDNISGDTIEVTISRVIDGDTIEVTPIDNKNNLRVRLIGINTPETVDENRPVECYGKEASDYVKNNFEGKKAIIVYDSKKEKRDDYGRELAYVELINNDNATYDLGEQLLELGLAEEYTYKYEYYQLRSIYRQLEKKARREKIGLWGNC